MEVVLGLGVLRHVPVLLLNFVTKFLHIDEIEDVCHALYLQFGMRFVHADRDNAGAGQGHSGHHPDRGDQPEEIGDCPGQ